VDRTRDLQIFSLTLSQLSYPRLILQQNFLHRKFQKSSQSLLPPKRFFKNQIPDSITSNAAISVLPFNYNFEVRKSVWRILSSGAKRVALQYPEGLLMNSLLLSGIFETFAGADECFVLGDVTYGACWLLRRRLLRLHARHSCLVPIDVVKILSLYVFAGTIQFSAAVRAAKSALSDAGFAAAVPQSKPLSAGEVLGCTSPSIPKNAVDVAVFVADGPFHLEAFMIANPGITAFRYDPYLKVLLWDEYDHGGMKEARKNAILKQPLQSIRGLDGSEVMTITGWVAGAQNCCIVYSNCFVEEFHAVWLGKDSIG
ncbi:hypothetical protein ACLOJK_007743, partial [Asimina triloba]